MRTLLSATATVIFILLGTLSASVATDITGETPDSFFIGMTLSDALVLAAKQGTFLRPNGGEGDYALGDSSPDNKSVLFKFCDDYLANMTDTELGSAAKWFEVVSSIEERFGKAHRYHNSDRNFMIWDIERKVLGVNLIEFPSSAGGGTYISVIMRSFGTSWPVSC